MEVAGPPVLLGDLKSNLQEVLVAVLLPIAARIGMPVESTKHAAAWVNYLVPGVRPPGLRQPNVGGISTHDSLSVGHLSVAVLDGVSR